MHEPPVPIHQPASDTSLFSMRGVFYYYSDDTQALYNIDLDIAAGDRIALVGQNGSGKTTLIKQLCGLLLPTSGEIYYKGEQLKGEHLDRNRLEIGLLFQDPDDQLFGHTLMDDTAFGPRHQGLSRQHADQAARTALERVNLLDMTYKAPHNLSFGQKKRAALAGLLAMQPNVLFLDEPTANLDPHQEDVFLNLLRDYSGTLICISHDLIFLYELCERALVLDHGRIHHDYTLRELVSHRQSLREHGLDFSFRLVHTVPSCCLSKSKPIDKSDLPLTFSGASEGKPLVVLRDYHYRYPDGTLALQGINLLIGNGERISIVGENGAGKTTLLRCLLGLRQGVGEFHFSGRLMTRRRRRALWRQVGMVFQDCADQLFCPSVREEITFGLHQLGHSREESSERLARVLSMVRLEGFEERVPLHLSGGERKRLALACVLAMEPELLILDEPTAGLDPQGEELLLDILCNLNATLLLVSHDIFFVEKLTSRTLVMHKGLILEDMPTHVFLQDERLGNLNELSYTYRQRSRDAILAMQHEHEHAHLHHHLHSHKHRHGELEHDHFHEHVHEHRHRFAHSHPGDEKDHEHIPRRYHEHEHREHESEDHHHDHPDHENDRDDHS